MTYSCLEHCKTKLLLTIIATYYCIMIVNLCDTIITLAILLHITRKIDNAQAIYSTRYPSLLDKALHFTQLAVENAHKRVLHNGVKETSTEIRSNF